MYELLIIIHSLLRWVLVVLAIVAIVMGFKGWFGTQSWEGRHTKISASLLGTTHLQIVLGLILYVGVSPLMGPIFSDFESAMKNGVLRFWAVEHIVTMILGALIIHVTHVMVKKAEEDHLKFKRSAIGFTLGFIVVMAGIPWPFREAGRSLLPSVLG